MNWQKLVLGYFDEINKGNPIEIFNYIINTYWDNFYYEYAKGYYKSKWHMFHSNVNDYVLNQIRLLQLNNPVSKVCLNLYKLNILKRKENIFGTCKWIYYKNEQNELANFKTE